jgi:predicted HTH transcriptional regulator
MPFRNIETENIEYKQSFADWKAIVESIAAFATASGGTIVIRSAVKTFLEKARRSGDTMTVLKNCRLLSDKNTLLNGAVVLFAKNPADFHLQSIVKCGRFAGAWETT